MWPTCTLLRSLPGLAPRSQLALALGHANLHYAAGRERSGAEREDAMSEDPETFRVFEWTQSLQSEHGLRFDDYQRYRRYLTRRLRRVRKSSGLTHGKGRFEARRLDDWEDDAPPEEDPAASTTRYVPARAARAARAVRAAPRRPGVPNADRPPPPRPRSENAGAKLMSALLLSQRSYAFAMDIKSQSYIGERWRGAKERRNFLRRLAKAVHWASALERICGRFCDARAQAEASAYLKNLEGLLLAEREDFSGAHASLKEAKRAMEALSAEGSLADKDRLSELLAALQPPLRWCRYNLGIDEAEDEDPGPAGARPAPSPGAAAAEALLFGGTLVPLPEAARAPVARALAAIGAFGLTAAEDRLAAGLALGPFRGAAAPDGFQRLFEELGGALSAIDDEAAKLSSLRSGERVEEQRRQLAAVSGCLRHRKDELVLLRTLLLAENASGGAAEAAHLYATMQQLCEETVRTESVADKEELLLAAGARGAACRALRVYKLAEARLQAVQQRERPERRRAAADEAAALFDHCANLSGDAIESCRGAMDALLEALDHAGEGAPGLEAAVEAARRFEGAVQAMVRLEAKCGGGRARVLAALAAGDLEAGGAAEAGGQGDIAERLGAFDAGRRDGSWDIARVPQGLRPIPAKPLFLDIAHHFVHFPDVDERAGVQKEAQQGGGWLGWLTG